MRGSGWAHPAAALVIWLVAVAWPMVGAISEMQTDRTSGMVSRPLGQLLATSIGWSLAVAAGAVLLGWAPGRLLGRLIRRRGFVPVAALLLAPICLPAYVAFWAWWQAWPPDSELYRWIVVNDQIGLARKVTLWLGLVCWSWPLVSWCVAGSVAAIPAEHEEMLRLDGARRWARLRDCLRNDGRGLACGALVVALAAFNNTTCFDLAEVFTFGNELRAMSAQGATAGDVLVAARPAMLIAALGAAVIWLTLAGRPRYAPLRSRAPSRGSCWLTVMIWSLSMAVPVFLISRNLARFTSPSEFAVLHGRAAGNTVMAAAACGALAALVAMGLGLAWEDHRRWVRTAATIQALGWLIMAVAPSIAVSATMEAAYNTPWLADAVYRSPLIVVLGHLASFGFVGVLLGRWAAMREPRTIVELRALDRGNTLRGQIVSGAPMLLAAGAGSAAIAGVLSMSETIVTAQLVPPGFEVLGPIVLNALHYQRPETVALATLATMGLALAAAALTAFAWRAMGRDHLSASQRTATSLDGRSVLRCLITAAALSTVVPGCARHDPDDPPPLDPTLIFGVNGVTLGQFSYPRGIAIDPQRQCVYVVDKTARVQRFGFDGKAQLEWSMPEHASGKPTGISVAPDGRVFVADTHYFRVIAFDSEGRELMRFGSFGTAPGEFIFPTDIAFGPQGRIYVSEYGGNDRVQVFSPDGRFLFAFGANGSEVGQFSRPQSMAFNADMSELYIADAINHRIVVVDLEGRWLRSFGAAGREPGQFNYPYGLAVLPDGSLMVGEFGGNRIQRVSASGQPLGIWGSVGPLPGQLRYPWSVAQSDQKVFVLDSGNNRVQVIRQPQ